MKLSISVILAMTVILACNKSNDKNLSLQERLDKGTSPASLLEDYPIDSFYTKNYQGGYIFHLEEDGTGMVVSPNDLSDVASWGCGGSTIGGADGSAIGTGKQNCDSILAQCIDEFSAAFICNDVTLSGYSDWYLPSEKELEKIYLKIRKKGVGNFENNFYWSSTEGSTFNTAYHVRFDNGTSGLSTKTNAHFVRAIRNF